VADYAFNHFLLPVPSEDEQGDSTSAASQAAVSTSVAGNSALLARVLTASPAPSIAAGAALAPTPSGNRQLIPLAAAASSGSTGQRFDGPTQLVAGPSEFDALFAGLGRNPLAEAL
jgi:hypothetical protein